MKKTIFIALTLSAAVAALNVHAQSAFDHMTKENNIGVRESEAPHPAERVQREPSAPREPVERRGGGGGHGARYSQ